MAPAGVVQKVPREGLAPVLQHPHQAAVFQMRRKLLLRQGRDAESGQRGFHHGRRRVENELSIHPHVQAPASPQEVPCIDPAAALHPHVDAIVPQQIARLPGRGMSLEIGRRGDNRHAQWRPDGHRDHVLVDRVPEPYACVEAVRDDVPESVVHVELQLDVRVLAHQRRQPGKNRGAQDVVAAGDAHRPGRLVTQLRQLVQFRLDFVEPVADRIQQALACRRRRHAACGARQQPDPQTRLEAADRLAQCRLRHAQQCRRAREAALARDGDEVQKVVEIASGHALLCHGLHQELISIAYKAFKH
ncbi:hypothetical protein AZ16_2350 [Bordetella bronchiseptica B18-5 (C3)]|nr:hypothetical protein AZ16_2350 [Bordetella bronchiseptica B18-5 (C3)]KDC45654.1 hypothetical protein L509_2331 [Bordetella bronchiseptica M85/00/2]KDD13114.1 hypothetical protein L523_2307 [Bordetella bronchiseptica MBORD731]KDD93501.1 hypothetical protein L524_2379 [Bordetella bronchiseptica MBORD762]